MHSSELYAKGYAIRMYEVDTPAYRQFFDGKDYYRLKAEDSPGVELIEGWPVVKAKDIRQWRV